MNEESRKAGKEHRQDAKPAKKAHCFVGGASSPANPSKTEEQTSTDHTDVTDFSEVERGKQERSRSVPAFLIRHYCCGRVIFITAARRAALHTAQPWRDALRRVRSCAMHYHKSSIGNLQSAMFRRRPQNHVSQNHQAASGRRDDFVSTILSAAAVLQTRRESVAVGPLALERGCGPSRERPRRHAS